jgi:hypothetical protein
MKEIEQSAVERMLSALSPEERDLLVLVDDEVKDVMEQRLKLANSGKKTKK